jgi:hypothetical protein
LIATDTRNLTFSEIRELYQRSPNDRRHDRQQQGLHAVPVKKHGSAMMTAALSGCDGFVTLSEYIDLALRGELVEFIPALAS